MKENGTLQVLYDGKVVGYLGEVHPEERLHLSTVRNGWKQDFLLVLFLCR